MRQGKIVLLAEEDLTIRKLVSEVLHNNGYIVLEAHSGLDALHVSERHKGSIDVLVADCEMPGMSGFELADRLRDSRPDLPVVLMSGSPEQTANSHIRGWSFVRKPFAPADIEAVIERVLGTGGDAQKTRKAG